MSGETNRLLGLAKELAPSKTGSAYGRELDMLAATGEQASSALLAIALQAEGLESVSYAGWQVPSKPTAPSPRPVSSRSTTCASAPI
jgi:aspartate kinase